MSNGVKSKWTGTTAVIQISELGADGKKREPRGRFGYFWEIIMRGRRYCGLLRPQTSDLLRDGRPRQTSSILPLALRRWVVHGC